MRPTPPRVSTLLNSSLSKLLTLRDSLVLTDIDQMVKNYDGLTQGGHLAQEYTEWHLETAKKLRKHAEVVRGRKMRFWDQTSNNFLDKQSGLVEHLQKIAARRQAALKAH